MTLFQKSLLVVGCADVVFVSLVQHKFFHRDTLTFDVADPPDVVLAPPIKHDFALKFFHADTLSATTDPPDVDAWAVDPPYANALANNPPDASDADALVGDSLVAVLDAQIQYNFFHPGTNTLYAAPIGCRPKNQ